MRRWTAEEAVAAQPQKLYHCISKLRFFIFVVVVGSDDHWRPCWRWMERCWLAGGGELETYVAIEYTWKVYAINDPDLYSPWMMYKLKRAPTIQLHSVYLIRHTSFRAKGIQSTIGLSRRTQIVSLWKIGRRGRRLQGSWDLWWAALYYNGVGQEEGRQFELNASSKSPDGIIHHDSVTMVYRSLNAVEISILLDIITPGSNK